MTFGLNAKTIFPLHKSYCEWLDLRKDEYNLAPVDEIYQFES
jgi:hypothetical protein